MSRIHEAMRRAASVREARPDRRRGYSLSGIPLGDDMEKPNQEGSPSGSSWPGVKPPNNQFRNTADIASPARDEVVKLVERVFVLPNSSAPRLVVFAAVDKTGSSIEICRCAAEIIAAQLSGSVCLVEGNVRDEAATELRTGSSFRGVTDAIRTSEPIQQFLTQATDKGFWIMPAGSSASETAGLFASDRWRQRMLELRDEFDYVLVDAPPITPYVDAILLGQMSDGLILVLEAHSTRRESARKAKETVESSNVRLLGAILNNRTFPVPAKLYRKL